MLRCLRRARFDLALALEAGDAFALDVAYAALDEALRLARSAGIVAAEEGTAT
ncbi:hypothetical protein [Streptomyces koyangensis]|uniref:hypothetical protein n=1 Tax=Streptomyces koyangensis TaxID=188770 RepID=UPI0033981E77